jgi:hypothetical protein
MFQACEVVALVGKNKQTLTRFNPENRAVQNNASGFAKAGDEHKAVVQKGRAHKQVAVAMPVELKRVRWQNRKTALNPGEEIPGFGQAFCQGLAEQ